MLSDHEEYELARLEESFGDSRWRRFLREVDGPLWRYRWQLRAAFAFGVLVTFCGAVTGSADVLNEGVLVTGLVVGYWAMMFLRREPWPPARHHGR